MKFDGHFMRNGVKVMATSHYRMFNHMVEPEHIGFGPGYHQRVKNLPLNDFRNAMIYYSLTNVYPDSYGKEWRLESAFMECQGNLGAFHKAQHTNHTVYN